MPLTRNTMSTRWLCASAPGSDEPRHQFQRSIAVAERGPNFLPVRLPDSASAFWNPLGRQLLSSWRLARDGVAEPLDRGGWWNSPSSACGRWWRRALGELARAGHHSHASLHTASVHDECSRGMEPSRNRGKFRCQRNADRLLECRTRVEWAPRRLRGESQHFAAETLTTRWLDPGSSGRMPPPLS